MRVEYLDYNKIFEMLREVKVEEFDRIVGVGRAGAILGSMLATKYDKRFSYCHISNNECEFLPQPKREEKILVVDDVIATGKTMKLVTSKLRGYNYKVFVFLSDESRREVNVKEDYFVMRESEDVWVLFPWDLIDFVLGERKGYSRGRIT
jgi:hypoxanthine phosphoribosyltransferase